MNCVRATFAFFLIIASHSSFAAETLYVKIDGKSAFEVLYHRATSTTMGAALGGLIGASIEAGIDHSKDGEIKNQLLPQLQDNAWQAHFLNQLNTKLEQNNYKAVWLEDGKTVKKGLLLTVKPEYHGIKVVNSTEQTVAAFIAFKATLIDERNVLYKDEPFYITSKAKRTLEQYLAEASPINGDLEYALDKAANRLANKIIYKIKD